MEFTTPLGFWLGLAGAGVLLTHLVRRRARRQVVPFLSLWSAAVTQQRGGFGAAVVRYLDLICVMLACGAVAVAGGTPVLPGRKDTTRDLVLVLDGGVELAAGGRHGKLLKVAEAEVRRRIPGTKIVVVSGGAISLGDPLQAVRAHRPGWTRSAPDVALAREAAKRLRYPDIVFCTYRPGRPEGFRLRTVHEPVRNAGIAGLEVITDPEGGGRLVRVTLRGNGPVEIEEVWSGEVHGRGTRDVPRRATRTR